MVRIQPTEMGLRNFDESHQRKLVDISDPIYKRGLAESTKIPPTEVGGLFRSSLRNKAIQTQSKAISATSLLRERRPDLNHPPTSVGVAPRKPVTRGRRKQETRQRYPVGEDSTETHLSKA